jgi:hypothetical protein
MTFQNPQTCTCGHSEECHRPFGIRWGFCTLDCICVKFAAAGQEAAA